MNVTKLTINKIIPDENQPRKHFDESKMGTLRSSIKRYGIKQPLTVEIQKGGTYLLLDGERRFRAAKELGMKEVPVVIEAEQSEIQRLIEQFHLQEQHEGWSPTEKAVAVTKLSESMNTTIEDISKMLGIPSRTLSTYISFGRIIDKASFQRSNVSIAAAQKVYGVISTARKLSEKEGLEFDRNTAKKLEQAIYLRIRNGEAQSGMSQHFFTRIKDSFVQNPKSIKDFIENDELSAEKLFSKTKAKGAYYLRHIRTNSGYLRKSMKGFGEESSIVLPKKNLTDLKLTYKELGEFIRRFEE